MTGTASGTVAGGTGGSQVVPPYEPHAGLLERRAVGAFAKDYMRRDRVLTQAKDRA